MSFLKNKTVPRFVLRRGIGKGKTGVVREIFLRTYRGGVRLCRL